jgi:hypothetical protein
MLRKILAALLGYAFIGVLIAGTDRLYAQMIPGFGSMSVPPTFYFVISMFTDTIYTLIGGWLCALISRGDRHATLGLIVLGELMGLASTVYLWKTVPHYYSFFLLIVYPPAVWIGTKLRKSTAIGIKVPG